MKLVVCVAENRLSRRRLLQKLQGSTLSGTADVPSCSGGGGWRSHRLHHPQPPSAGVVVLGVKFCCSGSGCVVWRVEMQASGV